MPKTEFFSPKYGKGKELCELLRKEFRMPECVVSFSVHFEVDELVKVDCRYIPKQQADA